MGAAVAGTLLEQGPLGLKLLRPLQLFGLPGLDQITHAMIWSMIANVGAYAAVSLSVSPSADEHRQARPTNGCRSSTG